MSKKKELKNLEQLLDRISRAARDNNQLSWGAIFEELGHTSFGPLLLVAGLVTLAPIVGDIPGVPTIMGIIILLIAFQLLFGRKHLWLPHWLLKRSVATEKLDKSIKWTRRPAHFIDSLLQPRLSIFIEGAAVYVIALVCIFIALMMPLMEVVPFSANAAGMVLTAFGLSLIARDGLLALLAFVLTAVTVAVVLYNVI